MNYMVELKNDGGMILYHQTIHAKDENEAIMKLITTERVLIASGDTITIEEL